MNLYAILTMATVLASIVGVNEMMTLTRQALSAENPSGLLVGEYSEKQIDGEKKAALLAADSEGYRMLRQRP